MAVRKTEAKIPKGFSPEDLGQVSYSGPDKKYLLISYLSEPLLISTEDRKFPTNTYVIFTKDTAVEQADKYSWKFSGFIPSTEEWPTLKHF